MKKNYGDNNGKNPSKKSANALVARRERNKTSGGLVSYEEATAGWLAAAIIAVTDEGGALQFGKSRDGGVFTLVILLDGEIEKVYVKQSEGIDQALEGIYHDFTTEVGTDGAT